MKYQVICGKYKTCMSFYFTSLKEAKEKVKELEKDDFQTALWRIKKDGTLVIY